MSLAIVADDIPEASTWQDRLRHLVRPEFQVDFYWPDPADPILGHASSPCIVDGCTNIRETGRLCGGHHRARKAFGASFEEFLVDPPAVEQVQSRRPRRCAVAVCQNTATDKGWCKAHFVAWDRRGRPSDWASIAPATKPWPDCRVRHCHLAAYSRTEGLCESHRAEWNTAGQPSLDEFARTGRLVAKSGAYQFHDLPATIALEMQYVLQVRKDENVGAIDPRRVNDLTKLLRSAAPAPVSFLDRPLEEWCAFLPSRSPRAFSFFRFAYERLAALAGEGHDGWDDDVWDLRRLGLHGPQTGKALRFDIISQPWLREAAKRSARYRLSRNRALATVVADVLAVRQLSTYLAETDPHVTARQLTRAHIEGFITWMADQMPHARTRNRRIGCVRVFLDDCRRFEWLPIPEGAKVYPEDFPRREDAVPRALSEDVMCQLETPENLSLLPDDGSRALVTVMMRTGLRVGDAAALPFNPIGYDSAGSPYLDFYMHKLKKDHRVPLDDVTEATIRTQQALVVARYPDGCPTLFPRLLHNPDGRWSYTYATLLRRLDTWVAACQIVDATGRPMRVTPHQFRHTLGTRMINDGHAQHVIQRLYGHESPEMTSVYARLSDQTLREEFERFHRNRVKISGEVVTYDPAAAGSEAEWTKERISRAKQTLPNGYCGRPLQQKCPHPNACLTCGDFLSDASFLEPHYDQLGRTRKLIATADASGQFRMAEMNREIEANLVRLIETIESLPD